MIHPHSHFKLYSDHGRVFSEKRGGQRCDLNTDWNTSHITIASVNLIYSVQMDLETHL